MERASDKPIVVLVEADPDQPVIERRREPVTVGIACPRGLSPSADNWALVHGAGREVPIQTAVLDRWGDGSVRWLLLDFQADLGPELSTRYELYPLSGAPAAPSGSSLNVHLSESAITVDTGVMTCRVSATGGFLFARAGGPRDSDAGNACFRLVAEDVTGRDHVLQASRVTMETSGPLRVVVRLDGVLRARDRTRLVDVVARLHLYAGSGVVRAEVSVTNSRRARHRNGYWDLGDPGSVYLKDLSIVLATDADEPVRCSTESSQPWALVDSPLEIYQDSSGGENWQSINHCNRDGKAPQTFRGYRVITRGVERRGLRATPIVSVGNGSSQITIAVPYYWQNWPKALEVGEGQLTLRLFPRQSSDVHELQGGERKTHVLFVCVGPDSISDTPLMWCLSPLLARADAGTYAAAGVWAPLRAGTEETRAGYEVLVNRAVAGPAAFSEKREVVDEFGWRHFGDIYADHEAVRQPGLVSHYNNQYDAIAGFGVRFCQTGDRRWWTALSELALHVTDIDIYHCTSDRAAFNQGHFWHTSHYLPAYTATHRSHSVKMPVPGGGPSAEHNYTTGLMLHHFLTGSGRSREAVLQLADWVLDMDDGAKSPFWWIDRGNTGRASATASIDYHGPGRGAGNSINALLDAHRLTGELRYLKKADQLVRRCISPGDDPEALDLLDAERRWSYTVFLQVLGKYLEYRAERGLIDGRYVYAQAALIRYAAWMARNEEPYLNHPERLEFPTETWAAQDIRKAAVFEFAACHEPSEQSRARFQQRADDFFNYSVSALLAAPTGSLTRPIVVLLAYGFQRPATIRDMPVTVRHMPMQLRATRRFVAYKRRVLRRLAILMTALTVAAGAVVLWLNY